MEEETEVEKESLGEEFRDYDEYDDDESTSVLSYIIDDEGADVWGKVLAAIHLMQGDC